MMWNNGNVMSWLEVTALEMGKEWGERKEDKKAKESSVTSLTLPSKKPRSLQKSLSTAAVTRCTTSWLTLSLAVSSSTRSTGTTRLRLP